MTDPLCQAQVYTDSYSNPSKRCERRAVEVVGRHRFCKQHAKRARAIGEKATTMGRR